MNGKRSDEAQVVFYYRDGSVMSVTRMSQSAARQVHETMERNGEWRHVSTDSNPYSFCSEFRSVENGSMAIVLIPNTANCPDS